MRVCCSTEILLLQEITVVVVSGMQLLRLRSAIRRRHPPQRVVLRQICCFGERKVLFQILLDGAEPREKLLCDEENLMGRCIMAMSL